jgi:hypothetical protein
MTADLEADGPTGGGRRRRPVVTIVAVSLATLVLVVGAVVASRGGDDRQQVAANCPDVGEVPTLSEEDQQILDDAENLACVGDPETTTTSIEPTTTTVEATVDTSPPVSRLTGSEDGLEVTVDVRPPELSAADVLTLAITARDADGGDIGISVKWEPDRGGDVHSHIDCPHPSPSAPTSEKTVERKFAFRRPGVAPIAVTVSTAYCADSGTERKTLTLSGKVVVGPGPLLSNGPLPADLRAWVSDTSSGSTKRIGVYAFEVDGFIRNIEMDWGVGAPGAVV